MKTSYPSVVLDDVEYTYRNSGEVHQRIVGSVLLEQEIDKEGRVKRVDRAPGDYTTFLYDKANNVTEAKTYENGHLKTE